MSEETEVTKPLATRAAHAARKAAAARNHTAGAIATLNRYNEPHFDLALLPRTDWPDEIWDSRIAKVMRALGAALKGEEQTSFVEAEAPELQIDGLRKFQAAQSEYWQWSEFEIAKLTEYLEQHPGHVITPHYAHSCEVKTPEGRVYHYHRSGRLE